MVDLEKIRAGISRLSKSGSCSAICTTGPEWYGRGLQTEELVIMVSDACDELEKLRKDSKQFME